MNAAPAVSFLLSVMSFNITNQSLQSINHNPYLFCSIAITGRCKLIPEVAAPSNNVTVETSLQYEPTPFPLSLFDNKDQKINQANKAGSTKTNLKELTDPLDLTDKSGGTLVIDRLIADGFSTW